MNVLFLSNELLRVMLKQDPSNKTLRKLYEERLEEKKKKKET